MVRVRPDLPAVERAFDYLVPTALVPRVEVGTIVRVPLHGRSVRGWVLATEVEPETERSRLLELRRVVGAGPSAEVVDLARWAAVQWAGSEVSVLAAASAPNAVTEPVPVAAPTVPGPGHTVRVLAWPPAADRRDMVAGLLAASGSTIVITPDLARIDRLVRHLERAGHRVHALHSGRSDAQRTQAWAAARSGGCVVVGGRSAVWAPVPDLAAIVVLDEADEALQEERNPTWHARDVAIERARRRRVPCTLVAAIPTAIAVTRADTVARPSRDAERAGWPRLEVVDLREEAPGQALLSDALARALHRTLDRGARALCVLNRRGRARLLACGSCRELVRCEACGGAVEETETEGGRALRCRVCTATRPWVCAACASVRLRAIRVGVHRVRDDLAALLPRATVLDVDAATEGRPDADVLVGTEAVLHRVPTDRPVGLVALLEADQELLAPRYRAAEQAATLLARAARRLGPRTDDGTLLVQTRVPEHDVLLAVGAADPSLAWLAEVARRRALGYPPFGGLAQVRGEHDAVERFAAELRTTADATVLGPVAAGVGAEVLVRAADPEVLATVVAPALRAARPIGRLRIEVDPPRV
ncbi:MAG: hypothetical protein ACKO2C_03560 [Actinomycetes bacterium]